LMAFEVSTTGIGHSIPVQSRTWSAWISVVKLGLPSGAPARRVVRHPWGANTFAYAYTRMSWPQYAGWTMPPSNNLGSFGPRELPSSPWGHVALGCDTGECVVRVLPPWCPLALGCDTQPCSVRFLPSWGRWQPTSGRLTEGASTPAGNRDSPPPRLRRYSPQRGEKRRPHPSTTPKPSHYREMRHPKGGET
jgi:hypothetical protein